MTDTRNTILTALIITVLLASSIQMTAQPASAVGHASRDAVQTTFYMHKDWNLDTNEPSGSSDTKIECKRSNVLQNKTIYVGNWSYVVNDFEVNMSGPLSFDMYMSYEGQTPVLQTARLQFELKKNNQDSLTSWTTIMTPPIKPGTLSQFKGTVHMGNVSLVKNDYITLTVTCVVPRSGFFFLLDSIEHPSSFTVNMNVIDQPPSVYITPDNTVFTTLTPMNFSIMGFDVDSELAAYWIDWEGDGVWDTVMNTSETTLKVTHAWPKAGTYQMTVRVFDSEGKYGDNSVTLDVRNRRPTARINLATTHVYPGITVVFNGSGEDQDGYIAYYRWDFDGDGVWDFGSNVSANTTHTYTHVGQFNAVLQVEDDDGGLGNASISILVDSNQPPTAHVISISPINPYNLETVDFRGEGFDPDGTITAYEWRSDIDGFLSDKPEFKTRKLSIGQHKISFRVRDNGSKWSDWVENTVTVSDWTAPVRVTATSAAETAPSVIYQDDMYVMAYSTGGRILLTHSDDGSAWSIPVEVGPGTSPSLVYFKGSYYVAYELDGSIYVNYGVDLSNWNTPIEVIGSTSGLTYHMPALLADESRIYLAYVCMAGSASEGISNIYVKSSLDGFTWGDGIPITSDTSVNTAPNMIKTTDGDIYILFSSDRDGSFDIWYSSSKDGSVFNMPKSLLEGNGDLLNVSAVEDESGNIWIYYDDNGTLYNTWTEDMIDFSIPKPILDRDNYLQVDPSVTVSNGLLGIVWARYFNGNADIYYSNRTLNLPPVAVISSPEDGSTYTTEDTIFFSANGSYDEDGNVVSYTWTSDISGELNSNKSFSTKLEKGNHTITLMVRDDKGAIGRKAISITVTQPVNHPPIADAGSDITATTGEKITFDGSGSSDPDGDPITYSWDFDASDGDADHDASGVHPQHTYDTENVYIVTLWVEDSHGARSSDTISVTVVPNSAPTANAGPDLRGNINDFITFDGSRSSDPDGDTLHYTWDFGDGASGSGMVTSHKYSAAGTYHVKLTVNDGKGGEDSDTINVTINTPPEAKISAPDSAIVGELITFDGSGSTDADGDALAYVWDFDASDGTDNRDADTQIAKHTYLNPGTYTVTLKVDDGRGGNSTATHTIVISPAKENQAPIAKIVNPSPLIVKVKEYITFDGSASYDPDDDTNGNGVIDGDEVDTLSYSWDFGNGNTGSGRTKRYRYSEAGTYKVVLTVTDTGGEVAQDSIEVKVNNPPVANAGNSITAYIGSEVEFDGSGSSDADNDKLTYIWDFGDGTNSTGVKVTHIYTSTGAYTATLNVSDGKHFSLDTVTVTIIDIPAPVPDGVQHSGSHYIISGTLPPDADSKGLVVYYQIGSDSDGGWEATDDDSEASDYSTWSVEIDLSKYSGTVTVYFIAAYPDFSYQSETATQGVSLNTGEQGTEEETSTANSGGIIGKATALYMNYRTYTLAGVATLVFLIILAILIHVVRKRRRRNSMSLRNDPELSHLSEEELNELEKGISAKPGTVEYSLEVEKIKEKLRRRKTESAEGHLAKDKKEDSGDDIVDDVLTVNLQCPICHKEFTKEVGETALDANDFVRFQCPKCGVRGKISSSSVRKLAKKRNLPAVIPSSE